LPLAILRVRLATLTYRPGVVNGPAWGERTGKAVIDGNRETAIPGASLASLWRDGNHPKRMW